MIVNRHIEMKPKIFFFIPKENYSENFPKSLKDDWVSFGGGARIWTYFTAIALKDSGYSVEITTKLPEEGIVLSHSRYLPTIIYPKKNRLIICIRADYGRKYSADMHIVQNRYQIKNRGREFFEFLFSPGLNYYIPYWSQPGLIPRDPSRKDLFMNVAYMGAPQNLDPALKSEEWTARLAKEGINFFKIFDRHLWHDYSYIDAILAIRPKTGDHHSRKPPSKLVNAWLARIPAILSPDSAFIEIYKNEKDFIRASNAEEAFIAILNLKSNKLLRRKIVKNGIQRSLEYTNKANIQRWITFLQEFAIPLYKKRLNWNKFHFFYYQKIKLIRMRIRNYSKK
jgi:hypothetical protein